MYSADDYRAFIEYNQRIVALFKADIVQFRKTKPLQYLQRIKHRRKLIKQHHRIISGLTTKLIALQTMNKKPA